MDTTRRAGLLADALYAVLVLVHLVLDAVSALGISTLHGVGSAMAVGLGGPALAGLCGLLRPDVSWRPVVAAVGAAVAQRLPAAIIAALTVPPPVRALSLTKRS